MKTYYTLFCTILWCFLINAQENKVQKANKKFDKYAYVNAQVDYKYLISKGYSSGEIFSKLGDANYFNANYKEAASWYQKLIANDTITVDAEYYYRYAQCLKTIEEYGKANELLRLFSQKKPEDNRAVKFNENINYLKTIEKNSGRYTIKDSPINSEYSDMAPSFYGEKLVFATARDTGFFRKNIHLWDNNSFKDLYVTKITADSVIEKPVKFSKKINLRTEESTTAFTKDGTTVYFTRTNSVKKKFKRDSSSVSRLKLYRATLKNNEWTNIEALPFNSDYYSVAHPTLNANETELYFASNMPGTIGGSDIFKVAVNNDGSFGTPVNLGKNINTEGRETFPFISSDNTLYFSSDGHPGLGGLDVFKVEVSEIENGKIYNVGIPVNGTTDDFGYIVNDEIKKGYFVSNRKGNDNIYSFIENKDIVNEQEFTFTGTVKEEYTLKLVNDAKVEIINAEGEKITEKLTNTDGFFNIETRLKNGSYKIVVSKENYETNEFNFEINNLISNYKVNIILLKKIYKKSEVGEDLAKVLDLGPQALYFDFDKADILPASEIVLKRVIEYLNKYPEIAIDIRSHTDASGNDAYNMQLSARRAKSTADYLIKNGIDASRVTSKGYGETQLINDCKNAENCTDEQNQLNRRSEFIVVKSDK